MGMNIKTEEAHQLAKKIAAKTGESITVAVTTSLRERLAKIEKEDRIERLTAIATKIAKRLNAPDGPKMVEIDDLYDEETGLPK